MNEKLYNSITNIDEKYIEEAQNVKKKIRLRKWIIAAACLCLAAGACIPAALQKSQNLSSTRLTMPGAFVPISLLLKDKGNVFEYSLETNVNIPIYTNHNPVCKPAPLFGVYSKVYSVESDVLYQSIGSNINGQSDWYYVMGHTDLQYLIHKDTDGYSLWKFKCLNANNYSYDTVLKSVYNITSADDILEIRVNPPTFDNSNSGKRAQNAIGSYSITDRSSIESLYETLSSMTCYGENNWDIIDYGASDTEKLYSDSTYLGRYLTITTGYGNEIDGLKYTAVSDMFYEFSGIAYNKLTSEQSTKIKEILGIIAVCK